MKDENKKRNKRYLLMFFVLGILVFTVPPTIALQLNDLIDCNVPTPNDNEVLTYDTATANWTAEESVAGKENLSELNDVDVTGVQDKDFLQYNGANWVDFDLFNTANTWLQTNTFNQNIILNSDLDVYGVTYLGSLTNYIKVSRTGDMTLHGNAILRHDSLSNRDNKSNHLWAMPVDGTRNFTDDVIFEDDIIVENNIYVADRVTHIGNENTFLGWGIDSYYFACGGNSMLSLRGDISQLAVIGNEQGGFPFEYDVDFDWVQSGTGDTFFHLDAEYGLTNVTDLNVDEINGVDDFGLWHNNSGDLWYDGDILIGDTYNYGGNTDFSMITSNNYARSRLWCFDDGLTYPTLSFCKSDTDTVGTLTTTDLGDILGSLFFYGIDNNNLLNSGAYIRAQQTGASGSRVPCKFEIIVASDSGGFISATFLYNRVGIFDSTPDVGFELDVNGDIQCTRLDETSDWRIKENFVDVDDDTILRLCRNLRLYLYEYHNFTTGDGNTSDNWINFSCDSDTFGYSPVAQEVYMQLNNSFGEDIARSVVHVGSEHELWSLNNNVIQYIFARGWQINDARMTNMENWLMKYGYDVKEEY